MSQFAACGIAVRCRKRQTETLPDAATGDGFGPPLPGVPRAFSPTGTRVFYANTLTWGT